MMPARHGRFLATLILASGLIAVCAASAEPAKNPRPRLDLFGDPLPPGAVARLGTMRHVRAVEALEQVGTDEARQLLRKRAKGSECARLTREAKASLQRLDRRVDPSRARSAAE